MIRYDSNLNSELVKAVRNYNAKIARLESKGIETKLEKASLRTVRRQFQERSDLLSYIRELRAFGRRGVERIAFIDRYDNPVTDYEINVAKSRQRRAIRLAEKRIEEAKKFIKTTGGEEELESLMGTDYVNNLQANLQRLKENKFTKKLSQTRQAQIIRSARAVINIDKTNERVRSNFFEILRKECDFAGVSQGTYQKIADKLGKMNAQAWELARSGEQTIVALMENYPRMREAQSEAERQALKNDLRTLINTLEASIDQVVDYYSSPKEE